MSPGGGIGDQFVGWIVGFIFLMLIIQVLPHLLVALALGLVLAFRQILAALMPTLAAIAVGILAVGLLALGVFSRISRALRRRSLEQARWQSQDQQRARRAVRMPAEAVPVARRRGGWDDDDDPVLGGGDQEP